MIQDVAEELRKKHGLGGDVGVDETAGTAGVNPAGGALLLKGVEAVKNLTGADWSTRWCLTAG